MKNLTPKQLDIVKFIRDCRVRHGYSPTMTEIAREFGVSKVTIYEHIEAILKKGALERVPNRARSLSIPEGFRLPDEEQPMRFPLIGRIAAGHPIEKFEQQDELNVADMLGPQVGRVGPTFALQVEGDSMRDEGILDGDYVIVERRETAQNGDRVVALLPDGQTTLKTYFQEADHIRLQPANPDYEPIRVTECAIQGVVIGVLRRY